MVPVCLERDVGMTIVVVPYRQLTNEFVKRAVGLGIDCVEWKYDTVDAATLVVVSADMLVNFRFLDYAVHMTEKGRLRRVFVDECHLSFTAHSWRPKLAHLKNIRRLRVPTIFLTATLPPTLVFDFEESMALEMARYIRASTVRKRTRYYVHECRRGMLMETVADSCRRRKAHLKRGEKGVVYCRSRTETEGLAAELNCGFVHAGAVENEASIKRWLERGGFIVATSALGTGVDFPGIVFVLHAGMPYGMIDYAQESGRAGRAGETVSSLIVIEEGFLEGLEKRGLIRSIDEEALVQYLRTEGCRREVFSRYFDGEEVCCEDGGMVRCDRCGEGEADVQRSERVVAEDRKGICEILDEVADGCTTCWLEDLEGRDSGRVVGREWRHKGEACREAEKREREVGEFRRGLRFERATHSCFKCGFSQKICRTGVDSSEKCQWGGIMSRVVIAATRSPMGRGIIRRAGWKGELGGRETGEGEEKGEEEGGWGKLDGYREWLGWRHGNRIWGELMSNAMAVVLEFVLWSESIE